jgi:hypothetical protein
MVIILVTLIDVGNEALSGFHFACVFLAHGQFVPVYHYVLNLPQGCLK